MKLMLNVSAMIAGASLAIWQAPGLMENQSSGSRGETPMHEPLAPERSIAASRAASGVSDNVAPARPAGLPAAQSELREPLTIVAGAGLVLQRQLHPNGEFAGYRVLQSPNDPRFQVGDVITAINGRTAEDSAAGTELLLIALRHPETPVQANRYLAGQRADARLPSD